MAETSEDRLYEQWMAALVERALQQRIEEEIRADEAALSPEETEEMRAALAEMRPRMSPRIERALRQQRAKQAWQQRLMGGLRKAATAVAVLSVVFSGFCLASPAIRAHLYQMSAEDRQTHTRITMDVDWSRLAEVPEEWLGHYYPMYIPERLSRVDLGDDNLPEVDFYVAMFTNPEDENDNVIFQEIGFGDKDSGGSMSVDTEGAIVYNETMNGHDVMVIEQDYGITFIWQDGTHILYLSGGTDMEEVRMIYGNVERIKD